jgi:hypothetical protein
VQAKTTEEARKNAHNTLSELMNLYCKVDSNSASSAKEAKKGIQRRAEEAVVSGFRANADVEIMDCNEDEKEEDKNCKKRKSQEAEKEEDKNCKKRKSQEAEKEREDSSTSTSKSDAIDGQEKNGNPIKRDEPGKAPVVEIKIDEDGDEVEYLCEVKHDVTGTRNTPMNSPMKISDVRGPIQMPSPKTEHSEDGDKDIEVVEASSPPMAYFIGVPASPQIIFVDNMNSGIGRMSGNMRDQLLRTLVNSQSQQSCSQPSCSQKNHYSQQ